MRKHKDDNHAKSMPDEEEIRRICRQEIQPTWSEREKRKRGGTDGVVRWKLPVVKLDDLPDVFRLMLESINNDDDHDHKSEADLRR